MTKPQFAAEPTMEDILASIRKMISEERMGPRPIPDQMSRTAFGEASPVVAAAAPANVAPANIEPQIERTPLPAERPERTSLPVERPERAAADRPDRTVPERPERTAPSFSSLSDALKAAKSPAEQRRSLEEKIADMLESGPGSASATAAPVDPLAVFAAGRASPSSPAQLSPGGAAPSPTRQAGRAPLDRDGSSVVEAHGKSSPAHPPGPASRTTDASANGVAPHGNSKPMDLGAVIPPRSDAPSPQRDESQTKPSAAPGKIVRPAAGEPKPEAQRIVSMPSRLPAASGAGQAGVAPSGPANGSIVSPFGVKQSGATQATRPASALGTADRIPDEPAKDGPAVSARAEESKAQGPGQATGLATGLGEKSATAEIVASVVAAEAGAAAASGGPSEALIDAVVDLVHNEPASLSVFTSGSAFINGVGSQGVGAEKLPGVTRKLDRSAAELLRPMLRQWLAENMPRIVEEALRSEFMSSQSPAKDSEKA